MTEMISKNELRDAADVDPNLIGSKVTKRFFPKFGKPQLNPDEIKGLSEIDSRQITLADIQEWVDSSIIYFESMGRVQLQPNKQRKFNEAKELRNLLVHKEYSQAAAFFLKKAKREWRGSLIGVEDDKDESTLRILGMEDVSTVPENVRVKGDSAIKQFFMDKEKGLILRMAHETSATYLRQAAVLARLIKI